MAWVRGLGRLVDAYLEEGCGGRGSLREAIELAASPPTHLNSARSSTDARAVAKNGKRLHDRDSDSGASCSDGEDDDDVGGHRGYPAAVNGDADEDEDDDADEDDDDDAEEDDDEDYGYDNDAVALGLRMERLKRSLARWRQEHDAGTAGSLRTALSRLLRGLPRLLALLEPLAEVLALRFVGGSDFLCDQMMHGWVGELVANLLCAYVGAVGSAENRVRAEEALASVAAVDEGRASLAATVHRLTRLVPRAWTPESRCELAAAYMQLDGQPRLQRACVLALCKPYLGSVELIERANHLMSHSAQASERNFERGLDLASFVASAPLPAGLDAHDHRVATTLLARLNAASLENEKPTKTEKARKLASTTGSADLLQALGLGAGAFERALVATVDDAVNSALLPPGAARDELRRVGRPADLLELYCGDKSRSQVLADNVANIAEDVRHLDAYAANLLCASATVILQD